MRPVVAASIFLVATVALSAQARHLKPTDAKKHRGEIATVCGVVLTFACTRAEGTDLNLDPVTGRSRFTIVIPPGVRSAFGNRVEDRFHRRTVCATGRIELAASRHQIVATRPEDVFVEREPTPPAPMFAPYAHRPCDPDVELPILRKQVQPAYTRNTLRAHIQGRVYMQGVVQLHGTVGEIEVLHGLHPELDEQAVLAFGGWQFEPGTFQGRPAPTIVTVEMTFTVK